MKTKCPGCGAKIQSINPSEKGYIKSDVYLKNPDNFYCERCFNLIHYGKNFKVNVSSQDFKQYIELINKEEALVCYVVDSFDLEGTLEDKINELFPNNKILVVANKFDLFLSSVNPMKVKNYIANHLKERNIKFTDLIVMSCFYKEDINLLLNKIEKLSLNKNVYFVGYTNVGKSSLINQIIGFLELKEEYITVDSSVGTTLGLIKIPYKNKTFLMDTPGMINSNQVTYYLNDKTLDKIMNKKFVKPKVFQLKENQSLFVGGFLRVDTMENSKMSFVTYVSNNLVIHRTKREKADVFYQDHKYDILLCPNEEENTQMGSIVKYEYEIIQGQKVDVCLSGLGFVSISGEGIINVYSFDKIKVSFRKSII